MPPLPHNKLLAGKQSLYRQSCLGFSYETDSVFWPKKHPNSRKFNLTSQSATPLPWFLLSARDYPFISVCEASHIEHKSTFAPCWSEQQCVGCHLNGDSPNRDSNFCTLYRLF